MNDLERFKQFLIEMKIDFVERINYHVVVLDIDESHLRKNGYGTSLDIVFDKSGNFIEFAPWGE